jgi:3-oxoadipate enol-lactonase
MQAHINQIQYHYEDRGQGLPVVFLHGYPLSGAIWQPVFELLDGSYRLIAPDLRGHGSTQAPPGVYSMELIASDVTALMDILGIEKAVMVGHSMGGYAAMAFARLYPARLAGLGLIATRAGADTPEVRSDRLGTAQEVLQKGVESVADSMPARLTAVPALIASVSELILQMEPQGIAGALRGMAERADSMAILKTLQVPAMVIAGDRDRIVPLEEARQMAALIPDCRLVTVSGAGHLPMLENAEETAVAIKGLLSRVKLRN